jgi:YegS/Rv2252/BmrU family lipid kinase
LVSVIINPISGGARPDAARVRAQIALDAVERHGDHAEVFITERSGHARELAKSAVRRGARLVLAWGGDGTINEVASALAFDDVPLGVVPSGSGNGLATELGISKRAERAIAAALQATPHRIDLGEIAGRLFVNLAGVGIDAYVAHEFGRASNVRRGFLTYAKITGRALLDYVPTRCRIVSDEGIVDTQALLVTIANGTQYGNNARIAPQARLDDGLLDLVVVQASSRLRTFANVPRLFTGTADRVPGCTMRRIRAAAIEADEPIVFHVDGEPVLGGKSLNVRIHPGALWVVAPAFEGRDVQPLPTPAARPTRR